MTEIRRWAHLTPDPWRNGGGITREVAAGDGWRVSIADIDSDGPFSVFPQTDRVITLLDGPAPVLTVDGRDVQLQLLCPFSFDGAATTSARRDCAGTSRDLNLMTRRGRCIGSIQIEPAGRVEDAAVIVVVDGTATFAAAHLGRFDCIVATGPVELAGAATVAVVRVARA